MWVCDAVVLLILMKQDVPLYSSQPLEYASSIANPFVELINHN